MRASVSKSAFCIAAVALLAAGASLSAGAKTKAATPKAPAAERAKGFQILDNLGYKGRPDTAPLGMVHCSIFYGKGRYDEQSFKEKLRKKHFTAGPVVIDIEDLNLKGADGDEIIKMFINLVKWTHEVVPGSIVGYYGHGLYPNPPDKAHAAQAKELAKAVDAFFPSMYVFDDHRDKWKSKLESLLNEAHEVAPGKPVYPYIWPQYHEGSAKALKFIDGDYWKFQLETARASGADGVVLWSGGSSAWSDSAAWWQSTLKFAAELKQRR